MKMSERFEIVSRMLELAETCQEGLEYARDALGRGMVGDSLSVLADALEAFSRMEASLRPLLPGLPENQLPELAGRLRGVFELMASAHESGSTGKALEYTQFVLVPSYHW
jgi:hypothetical protein